MENISHQKALQDKYLSRNPISRWLINGFFNSLLILLGRAGVESSASVMLEVGCGEGELLQRISADLDIGRVIACDIDFGRLDEAKVVLPARVFAGSIYELPFEDASISTIICCEVLEHLIDPRRALEELSRVSSDALVLSVPNEPTWRILNMARGKYWNDFGNTPGHLNHWSKSKFISLIGEFFHVEKVLSPLPWTMMLVRKR